MTLRDVTARRRLAEQEREGDLILRQVLGACPAAVFMAELDRGQILYRSPAATDLVGPIRSGRELFASREENADFHTELMPTGRVDAMTVTCRHAAAASSPPRSPPG
jgi:PAS domain-containing protein